MIRIAVPGVSGRMGAAIAQQVLQAEDLELTVATVRSGSSLVGSKIANGSLTIVDKLPDINLDVLIDFTLPSGVMQHLEYCLQHQVAMVIGSTGFSDLELLQIQHAANQIPILQASNMSLGVNLYYRLLEIAAQLFDPSWQVSISDVHHIHKKDSPSGTAKQMAQVLALAIGTGAEIPIQSERRGDVVGEHTVTFAGNGDKIMISHVAEDRNIFALGSLEAARWLFGKEPGLYNMQDVVG